MAISNKTRKIFWARSGNVIAASCLPVGLGHLKLRRWALTLTRLYLWFWLGAGIMLAGNLILLIPSALLKGTSENSALDFGTRLC